MAHKLLGQDFLPHDVVAKVTGEAKYAEDFRAEGMVFARLLSSPYPHARVRSIDVSEALKVPGVVGVLLPEDVKNPEAPEIPLLTLERLTYRFATAGFVLLSATLLAGWLFGETLYGHAWRWDHKSVFSVLAWICLAALMVGRFGLGWRGKRAVIVLYVGAALLLLAYIGSRFVTEIVLGRTQ